jgi:8-amino-7-oxononanoate synthase
MTDEFYQSELDHLVHERLLRQLRAVETPAGRTVHIGGEEKIVFASNNYLGLAGHRAILSAAKAALDQWGFGAGASQLICGRTAAHERLQRRLATALRKDDCLILPSGYQTNLAVLSTLPQPGDLIALDKLAHASLIDGAHASRAELRIFPHRGADKLRRLLDHGGFKRAFIVTDSLFSMDGDFADLNELVEIKKRYDAILILDEAHAFGCLGPGGLGLADSLGLLDQIDVFLATFSKALGGAGGFVAANQTLIDYLVNRARPLIFSTGVPAMHCAAVEAALDLVAAEPDRRGRLLDNADCLRRRCRDMGLNIGDSQSCIIPIILGSPESALVAADRLWRCGCWAPAVRPPAVPTAASRLRISVTSDHTSGDLDALTDALNAI